MVEYARFKKGDFRIDGDIVVEVGGQDKGFGQIEGQPNAYVAANDIKSAIFKKFPFGHSVFSIKVLPYGVYSLHHRSVLPNRFLGIAFGCRVFNVLDEEE